MFTILLLTALDGWAYEGFASDPPPAAASAPPRRPKVVPPAPPAVPPPPPAVPPAPPAAPAPAAPVPPASAAPKAKPAATPAVAAPKPTAQAPAVAYEYQLADANGQVWRHADPDWLRRWVDARNASIRPVYSAPVYGGSWVTAPACATGNCPRR